MQCLLQARLHGDIRQDCGKSGIRRKTSAKS